jgi:hypothetical protein
MLVQLTPLISRHNLQANPGHSGLLFFSSQIFKQWPVAGGYRPLAGGYRPVAGGYRPVAGGYRRWLVATISDFAAFLKEILCNTTKSRRYCSHQLQSLN